MLLALKMEKGAMCKECGWTLHTSKGEEMDSPLELPKECSPAGTF